MGKRVEIPAYPLAAVQRLPWRQQMAVRLVRDGYTEEQAAGFLGVTRETVARDLHEALAALVKTG